MKLQKADFYTLTAALTLGSLSMGFSLTASATTIADAAASFQLTLTGVTDTVGSVVTTGWSVDASGYDDGIFVDMPTAGTADAVSVVVDPAVSLSIGNMITQTASVSATSINGIASASIFTWLDIIVENNSGEDLLFSFSYGALTGANTSGQYSSASGDVDFLDDLGAVDILQSNESFDGINDPLFAQYTPGTFEFTLADGDSNLISGYVDAYAEADNVVPIPAAVWLFGSGLLGLVGVARRKKA